MFSNPEFKYLFYFILLPALLPVVLVFRYVYKKDRAEREPLGFVLFVLLMGAVFAPLAGILETIATQIITQFYTPETLDYEKVHNFLGVGLIEEFIKLIVLLIFVWRSPNFDYRYDGIVYAVASSLGFAALENVLYVIQFGTQVSIGRAIFAIPGHTTFGVFMGYYLSRAKNHKMQNHKIRQFFMSLYTITIPTLIHGAYDFLLSTPAKEAGYGNYFFIMIIVLDIWAWIIIRHEARTDRPLGVQRSGRI